MAFAIPRRGQRVDREHLIAGREQGLHPGAAIGLYPDHDVVRFVVAEVIGDQRVQGRDPRDAFRQPPTGQPSAVVILKFDVVVGLGPIVTDEQHRDMSSPRPGRSVDHGSGTA